MHFVIVMQKLCFRDTMQYCHILGWDCKVNVRFELIASLLFQCRTSIMLQIATDLELSRIVMRRRFTKLFELLFNS